MSRSEQKDETKRTILKAARQLFESRGFADTAIRDVASLAGVAAGTVLLHFRDKSDLLHAALFEELELAIDDTLASLPKGTLARRLGHITRHMFAYYERRPALSRTLLSESLLAPPPWAERFAAQTSKVHRAIVALAQQAVDHGELSAQAECELIGAAYFSFYYFALIAWVQGAHRDPVALVARLVRQHLDGLRPRPQSRAAKRPPERKKA